MDNEKKDLNKKNYKTIVNNRSRTKKLSQKKNKTPINTITIKTEKRNKNIIKLNKFGNQKRQNNKITLKKYSMDSKGLNIETNDIRNTLESNASDNFLNKKFELKTETYNNNTMIPKNITENFGTIILQKKMKLFNFLSEKEENKSNGNKDKEKIKENSEPINKKKIVISVKNSDREKDNKNKILYKKLKFNLNKDNKSNNDKNDAENTLKLETKINKNREILFNTRNETLKEQKENNIIFLKNNDNKLYNSNENLIKKKKEIKLYNSIYNKNKKEEKLNKDKLINFKKNITPIAINIDLVNNFDSNEINDKLPKKILLSSEKTSLDNKERIQIHHRIPRKKIETKKIFRVDKNKEKKNTKGDIIIKKDHTERPRKNKNKIREYNIETFTPHESRDIKKRKIINSDNDTLLLKTIEGNTLGKNAINKILINNHYKSLFTDIFENNKEKEINTKKKYKFSERKKNRENKESNMKLAESSESYYDLYKKAFNDTSSIEQKFCFKPKMNKKYFNYEHSNSNEYNDENNKTDYNNKKFIKKISSISFSSKREKNLKDLDEFDNNKNDILDLNHFIPIDENKLIYTFNKPLFGDKNNN